MGADRRGTGIKLGALAVAIAALLIAAWNTWARWHKPVAQPAGQSTGSVAQRQLPPNADAIVVDAAGVHLRTEDSGQTPSVKATAPISLQLATAAAPQRVEFYGREGDAPNPDPSYSPEQLRLIGAAEGGGPVVWNLAPGRRVAVFRRNSPR